MKKLIQIADRYIQTSDWKIIAVLKCCLISLGIIIGTHVSSKHKKGVFMGSMAVFVVSYVPLMAKFFSLFHSCGDSE